MFSTSVIRKIETDQPHISAEPYSIRIYERPDQERQQIEGFIQEIYKEKFNAKIHEFSPQLIGLKKGEKLIAAMGIRSGASERFFLEKYLDVHIEDAICSLSSDSVDRSRIVEVGQLAAAQAGQGRRLMQAAVPILAALGFEWVASTVTKELRQLLIRLGVVPFTLVKAHPACLGAQAQDWGSYYEHSPIVVAGRIQPAIESISRIGMREGEQYVQAC